jgi:uncharacterized protein YegP (UPF0339 family)
MAANFVVDKDALGRYQWHLRAANGNIIARSEQAYASREAAHKAIESVRTNAPDAAIVDGNVDYVATEKAIAKAHATAVENQRKLKQLYKKRFPNGVMISGNGKPPQKK